MIRSILLSIPLVLFAACSGSTEPVAKPGAPAGASGSITGAGSTFAFPIHRLHRLALHRLGPSWTIGLPRFAPPSAATETPFSATGKSPGRNAVRSAGGQSEHSRSVRGRYHVGGAASARPRAENPRCRRNAANGTMQQKIRERRKPGSGPGRRRKEKGP